MVNIFETDAFAGFLGGVGQGVSTGILNTSRRKRQRKQAKKDITASEKDLLDLEGLRQGASGIRSSQPMEEISRQASRAKQSISGSRGLFDRIFDRLF